MIIDLRSVIGAAAIPADETAAAGGALRRTLDLIGLAVSDLVQPGARVFLKPDLGDPSPTTERAWSDPQLVAAVARVFTETGASVLVGDSPFVDGTPVRRRWAEAGLLAPAGAEGFTLVDLEAATTRVAAVQDTVYFVPEVLVEADLVVNLARLRPHPWFGAAGALTNLLGVLPGFQKIRHLVRSGADGGYGRVLADLCAVLQPGLTILQFDLEPKDAPVWGILVSTDGVAVDAAVAQRTGAEEEAWPHIGPAADSGLGVGWREGIEIVGTASVPPAVPETGNPRLVRQRVMRWFGGFTEPLLWTRPELDGALCDGCGECVKSCPTKALRQCTGESLPAVEARLCVGCWHCRAVCAQGAVVAGQSSLARFLTASRRRNCAF